MIRNFIKEFDRVKKDYAQCYGAVHNLCKAKILELYKNDSYAQIYADTFSLYDTKIENDTVIAYVTIDIDGCGHLKYLDFTFKNEDFEDFLELYHINFHPYTKLEKSCKITIKKFIQGVKNEWLTDDDGHGYFATEEQVSDECVYFPDDWENCYKFPKWATHVVWYNK